jgi:hypothetical protein
LKIRPTSSEEIEAADLGKSCIHRRIRNHGSSGRDERGNDYSRRGP